MNRTTTPMKPILLCCCLALLSGPLLRAATATNPPAKTPAKPAVVAPPALQEIPRSIFIFDPASRGKDPFNPASGKAAESAANASRAAALPPVDSTSVLALKGIILGAKQRRLAIINNRDFAVGDTAEVTIPGGKVTVHCLDIGDGYAVVTVAGAPDRHLLRMRKE